MTRYEIYCCVCDNKITDLKDCGELKDEEYKKVLIGANYMYGCPRCYWKPFYNTLIVKVSLRKVKEHIIKNMLAWLES